MGRRTVRQEPDAAPFSLGPANAEAGVLLLHGFTGTPFEMRLLGESLASRGWAVEGPCLAGHGGTTWDLAATGWPDWVASGHRGLDQLARRARQIVVCGLSMGGLVTLELARTRPSDMVAICGLSTALFLADSAIRFVGVTRKVPLLDRAALPKLAGSDIKDREMRRRNNIAQGDAWMPINALGSLVDFGQHVREHLREIKLPALLAHSRRDHTVPFACLEAVASGLGTPRGEIRQLILESSHHVITLDVEREQVFRAVADHVSDHVTVFGGAAPNPR
jgi:carboxylesterase